MPGTGRTPLHWSCGARDIKTFEVLTRVCLEHEGALDTIDNEGMTALHWTALHGSAKQAQLLLKAGAHTDMVDIEGKTALHWTSGNAKGDIARTLLAHHPALVSLQDEEGRTAVHQAVAQGNTAVLLELLRWVLRVM
jgi:ankyrin repeat protein